MHASSDVAVGYHNQENKYHFIDSHCATMPQIETNNICTCFFLYQFLKKKMYKES